MFRLKIPRTQFKFGIQICRNYLSHEYKSVLSEFEITAADVNYARTKSSPAQGVIRIDIVNGIAHDNRNNEFSETFLKLRSEPQKATVFEATNYAIFRNFIDNENLDELLANVKNRLQSGLFVDDFIGCYLLNHFLQEQNYLAATEIGLEIFKQDTLDNKLLVSLMLKSFFEYLKQNLEQIATPLVKETKPTKKKDEVKVRVKFLRNTEDGQDLPTQIGRAICKISQLYSNHVTSNFKLLGSLLANKNDLATSLLLATNTNFCKDTLQYSQILLKNKKGVDEKLVNAINSSLEQTTDSKMLHDLLSSFLEAVKKEEEVKLIEQQKNKYAAWKEQDVVERNKSINGVPSGQRKENIDQILTDLAQKKQKLWYFDNEELIDLEIFKKNKSYPKRWFGKKKKPKVVDDNYVPPEIRKIA
ncbi:uncharacterized protein LOC118744697 [Rhagoletis pomonella]|uniref:uncharacterized protein LOC118744697 n=1 Tax=Rhagoletis pomonella TaxID=28610 RepID=UPI00177B4599|nr:uncharacterized protein LOC118744697 [Rhagoletis pomonella]